MAEGRRTELEQRLAKSRGRLPTDSELWCQRLARSLDERGAEGGTRAPAFRQSAGGPQRPADVPRRDLGGAARRPRAPDQSQVGGEPLARLGPRDARPRRAGAVRRARRTGRDRRAAVVVLRAALAHFQNRRDRSRRTRRAGGQAGLQRRHSAGACHLHATLASPGALEQRPAGENAPVCRGFV
jgi:hypothetical protein